MGRIFVLGLCFLSIIGYQNCSSELTVNPNFLCSPSPAHTLKAINFSVPVHCEDLKNYSCEKRVFKPNISNSTVSLNECLNLDGHGEVCVPLRQLSFSTGHIDESNEESSLFLEGSAYNSVEVSCANRLVLHNNKVLFSAEAESIGEALSRSIEKCREGGSLL